MLTILFLLYLRYTDATYVISVYGDVFQDYDFFTKTYPWIIDNVGGDITVDYYLLGSGRYSVPQMCVLKELRLNTFLQAQYLKCEAEGTPSEVCLCETGINPQKFKHCVTNEGSLASFASSKFQQLGIEVTPLIEIGPRNTVFKVDDEWYLKKICRIFGDSVPRGCVKPFACNGTEGYRSKRAVVQFDRCCDLSCGRDYDSTTAAMTTSGTKFTDSAYY